MTAIPVLAIVALATLAAGSVSLALARVPGTWRPAAMLVAIIAYGLLLAARPPHGAWVNAVLIAAAAAAGHAVGRTIRQGTAMIAFLITVAVVDYLSYTGGLTRSIIESHRSGQSDLLLFLAVTYFRPDGAVAVLGFGDLLIAAAVALAMRRRGYALGDALGAPIAGLLSAAAAGLTVGGIYALPFLAATVGLWMALRRPPPEASQASKRESRGHESRGHNT